MKMNRFIISDKFYKSDGCYQRYGGHEQTLAYL
jgi:hypothetical protein